MRGARVGSDTTVAPASQPPISVTQAPSQFVSRHATRVPRTTPSSRNAPAAANASERQAPQLSGPNRVPSQIVSCARADREASKTSQIDEPDEPDGRATSAL